MNRRIRPQTVPAVPNNATLSTLLEAGARNPDANRAALLREPSPRATAHPHLTALPAARGMPMRPIMRITSKMAVLEIGTGRALAGFTDTNVYGRFASVQHLTSVSIAAVEFVPLCLPGPVPGSHN